MKELRYKFTGTEADRLLFVDPEPQIGQVYTIEQYGQLIESNAKIGYVNKYFTPFEIDVPDPIKNPHDILTPMIRLELVKLGLNPEELKRAEHYIAFGS
jgi:hypothetical protein